MMERLGGGNPLSPRGLDIANGVEKLEEIMDVFDTESQD